MNNQMKLIITGETDVQNLADKVQGALNPEGTAIADELGSVMVVVSNKTIFEIIRGLQDMSVENQFGVVVRAFDMKDTLKFSCSIDKNMVTTKFE